MSQGMDVPTVEVPGMPHRYQATKLPGWKLVGTVTHQGLTGALVRNDQTGIYCQANAGELRTLPQIGVCSAIRVAYCQAYFSEFCADAACEGCDFWENDEPAEADPADDSIQISLTG